MGGSQHKPSPRRGGGLLPPLAAAWSPHRRSAGKVPRSVAIVAMGRSARVYLSKCAELGDRRLVADETWAINTIGGVIQHDRLFVMDDIPKILKPVAHPGSAVEGMFGWLADHPGPIYTSKAYPEFPGTVDFPLARVVAAVGIPYFSTTVAYAIGYAITIGVGQLQLYGCDFSYPDHHAAEAGRACCEFLLAIASSRDIELVIAEGSTLLDTAAPHRKIYGYFNPPGVRARAFKGD